MLRKYLPAHLCAPADAPASPPPAAPAAPAAPPAAPPPTSSATSGTPVPESTTGSASLVDEMTALLEKPAAPAAPKAPERGPDGKFKPGEATKPAEPKPGEPAKPADAPKPPADAHSKDPVALRKRLAEVEGQLKQTQAERDAEINKLSTKIKEFEGKQFVTPEQVAQNKAREERLQELEAERSAADFRKSPEFQRNFVEPWQQAWRSGVEDTKQLTITDPETQEARPATQQDFDRVRTAGSFVQQRNMAKSLFGDDWDVVMTHVNAMRGLEDRAAHEIARREQDFATNKQAETTTYQGAFDSTDAGLAEKYPKFFGNDPDMPEATAEMQKGLEFVDKALEQSRKAPPAEKGVAMATIRRWAAAFPRMHFILTKKDEEIASLREALAKYQGSDPGAGGENTGGGGGGADTTVKGGIEAAAAEFEKFQ